MVIDISCCSTDANGGRSIVQNCTTLCTRKAIPPPTVRPFLLYLIMEKLGVSSLLSKVLASCLVIKKIEWKLIFSGNI